MEETRAESPSDSPAPRERRRHRRRRERPRWRPELDWKSLAPLAVFAAIVVLAPLLFGAVDRVVQIGLAGLLALGMLLVAPSWPRLSRFGLFFSAALGVVLLGKELLPAGLFGGTQWRPEIDVSLPWTHHPEPARVFDLVLVAGVTILWFQWVRTLAADDGRRVKMAWILAGAGVVLALVCFGLKPNPARPNAIYGLRETEGWIGWGPFPNRNHTSSFLAMAGLCLAGCVWWAALKRKWILLGGGAVGLLLILGALLAGKSRGGLLAFGAGLGAMLALVLWRKRDRRTLFLAGAIVIIAAIGLLAFGGQVLERFRSAEQGIVSNETRVLIWGEALAMWKDAPLFGHGAETFSQLFPLYQKADLDGKTVLHPESSWLQWLVELGALPVVALSAALGWFLWRGLRLAMPQRRLFYLTAGLVAGTLSLLAHAAIDVPGHRWATAGFALALLGVAFPLREIAPAPRLLALLPLAIAGFWALPFAGVTPAWSPLAPTMLLNRETRSLGAPPTLAEWDRVLRFFPLDAWMRQYAGLRALEAGAADRARWERDFTAARQLLPCAWWLPEMQARAVGRMAVQISAAGRQRDLARALAVESISLWQDAVDRGGRQWSELLRGGVRETAGFPGARVMWGQFIDARPRMGLTYAQILMEELRLPDTSVRAYFDIWWEHLTAARPTDSATTPASRELAGDDAALYYRYAPRWSSAPQLEVWMKLYRKRLRFDYRQWVSLLHGWKKDERAWEVYTHALPEPAGIAPAAGSTRKSLEDALRVAPDNATVALELAHLLEKEGDHAASTRVLLAAAARPNPAPRVLREAAYRLAAEKRFPEAIEMALREKPGS